jgi:predicted DNA-binding WGR domain protein
MIKQKQTIISWLRTSYRQGQEMRKTFEMTAKVNAPYHHHHYQVIIIIGINLNHRQTML